MANLYEIASKYEQLLTNGFSVECVDEDGEIDTEKAKQLLDETEGALSEKVENIAMWVENLNADIKALKEKENAFKERRQSKEKKVEWLKRYLTECLDGRKFETPNIAISFRNSQSVSIVDEEKIPNIYFSEEIVRKVNKIAIKEVLKQGNTIDGVELVTNRNIQIK